MFRLNKDLEYALISLVGMSKYGNGECVSARVLSERYGIPYKILARVLQKLASGGILKAEKGASGGYRLLMDLDTLSLGRVMRTLRGHEEKIAVCLNKGGVCVQENYRCLIKPAVQNFQAHWTRLVENTTIQQFMNNTYT